MNPKELQEVSEMITAAVSTAMKNERCGCGLEADEQGKISHLVDCFRELGNGDIDAGIQLMRKGVSWLSSVRAFGAKLGGHLAVWVVIVIAGGFVALLVGGFLEWVKGGK